MWLHVGYFVAYIHVSTYVVLKTLWTFLKHFWIPSIAICLCPLYVYSQIWYFKSEKWHVTRIGGLKDAFFNQQNFFYFPNIAILKMFWNVHLDMCMFFNNLHILSKDFLKNFHVSPVTAGVKQECWFIDFLGFSNDILMKIWYFPLVMLEFFIRFLSLKCQFWM